MEQIFPLDGRLSEEQHQELANIKVNSRWSLGRRIVTVGIPEVDYSEQLQAKVASQYPFLKLIPLKTASLALPKDSRPDVFFASGDVVSLNRYALMSFLLKTAPNLAGDLDVEKTLKDFSVMTTSEQTEFMQKLQFGALKEARVIPMRQHRAYSFMKKPLQAVGTSLFLTTPAFWNITW